MTKFNVGDKVVPISKTVDWNTLNRVKDHLNESGTWNRALSNEQTYLYVNSIDRFNNLYICSNEQGGGGDYFHESDLTPYKTKPTKNQRITALENEVTELKLIIHELRGKKSIEPSTTFTVEDKPLTQNQQRAAIIEQAKNFVDENKYKYRSEWNIVGQTVQILIYDSNGMLMMFRQAKCNPSDVFNEHIGKAIALGRALGLDVSEFEQAVQPTIAVGQLVESSVSEIYKVFTLEGIMGNVKYKAKNGSWQNAEGGDLPNESWYKIINDTNAKYEEG